MNKEALLKSIASTGYNVGFGAKKHFATFDIVTKAPGWIGFISTAAGILALVFDPLSTKFPSAVLLILGSCTFYISGYKSKNYDEAGRRLTLVFNNLRNLFYTVESGGDLPSAYQRLIELECEFYEISISRQILFSDWYAHYKFFSQMQIDWVDKHIKFTVKDKVPLSLIICFAAIAVVISSSVFYWTI